MSKHIMCDSSALCTSKTFSRCENGQIQVIFGPMFSGKTTELLRRIKRYQIANYKCVLIKYARDDRYDSNAVCTHDRQSLPAISAVKLSVLHDEVKEYDVIGIDEGQFFADAVNFADRMAEAGKVVIVAALDGTFQRKGFGDILNLVPLAESVMKLTAVCMGCYNEASFTKRKGFETKVEIIGGTEKYESSCRRCFSSVNSVHGSDKENQALDCYIPMDSETLPPATKHTTRSKRPLGENRCEDLENISTMNQV